MGFLWNRRPTAGPLVESKDESEGVGAEAGRFGSGEEGDRCSSGPGRHICLDRCGRESSFNTVGMGESYYLWIIMIISWATVSIQPSWSTPCGNVAEVSCGGGWSRERKGDGGRTGVLKNGEVFGDYIIVNTEPKPQPPRPKARACGFQLVKLTG